VKVAAQQSSSKLSSAFALHFTCKVKRSGFDHTINSIYSPFKTHNAMNKTWKTILQVLSYIVTLLLGGAGAQTLM
jgi:hypothetical protein